MPTSLPSLRDSTEALAFREVRLPQGRVLAARGRDGSLYCFGKVSPGSPDCAWRQTPSGDRHWLAFDVPNQNAGTQACRRAAAAADRGDPLAVMSWPIRDSKDVASERRTPVRISRDAAGIWFEPLAHAAPSFLVSDHLVSDLLSGREDVRMPELAASSRDATVRVLAALRDAKGILTPGERLRAGATMTLLSTQLPDASPERKLVERTLGRLCAAVCPMLDLHSPKRQILDLARDALDLLSKAPPKAVTAQGRAWISGEAAPVLALLEGRLSAREAEMQEVGWAAEADAEESPAPAFA